VLVLFVGYTPRQEILIKSLNDYQNDYLFFFVVVAAAAVVVVLKTVVVVAFLFSILQKIV